MKRFAIVLALFAALAYATVAHATCADETTACYAACTPNTAPCFSSQGNSFSGVCIGGADDYNATTCPVTRCGSNARTCGAIVAKAGAPTGCSADSQCGSGYICVSSAGPGSCGTGFSQCIPSCSDSTTTTTSTTTTSTSTSTTT
jgi:hypothetical protein